MRLGKFFASQDGRRPTLVMLAMLLAAAINALQFANIDASIRSNQKALHVYGTFDIMQLGLTSSHIELSHNLFALIGQRAPGARLIVTTPQLARNSWFRSQMFGLGLMERIDVCEIDLASIDLKDPAVDLLATGAVAARGKQAEKPDLVWGIGTLSPEPKTLVQVETAEFDTLFLDADAYNLKLKDCK